MSDVFRPQHQAPTPTASGRHHGEYPHLVSCLWGRAPGIRLQQGEPAVQRTGNHLSGCSSPGTPDSGGASRDGGAQPPPLARPGIQSQVTRVAAPASCTQRIDPRPAAGEETTAGHRRRVQAARLRGLRLRRYSSNRSGPYRQRHEGRARIATGAALRLGCAHRRGTGEVCPAMRPLPPPHNAAPASLCLAVRWARSGVVAAASGVPGPTLSNPTSHTTLTTARPASTSSPSSGCRQ